jgi:hypothetical protein
VAVESDNFLKMYLDKIGSMEAVISGDKSKRVHLEKIGYGSLFAIDETKKLIAMLISHAVRSTQIINSLSDISEGLYPNSRLFV